MKRIIFSLAMAFCCISAYSQDNVTIKSGDVSVLSEEVAFSVEINDFNPLIDGKNQSAEEYYTEKSEKHYEDFVTSLKNSHKGFAEYFNKKKGKAIKSSVEAEGQYKLLVDIASMNVGNAGGMVWGVSPKAGGILINGDMTLIDSEGKTVCEMSFENVKGLMAPKFEDRAINVYRLLAKKLILEIEKTQENK